MVLIVSKIDMNVVPNHINQVLAAVRLSTQQMKDPKKNSKLRLPERHGC
jgi:hypothetical protein